MARVNVDILGISELRWTGMGEFNSDDHYSYYCGQESLRRNGVAIMVNKRVWNAVLSDSKMTMISVHFQGKPFNITVIQAYAPTSNTEKAEVKRFYEDIQDFLDLGLITRSGRSTGEGIGYPLYYSCASLVTHLVKSLSAIWETWVWSLSWEDHLEKGKATHSSIPAWRSLWMV